MNKPYNIYLIRHGETLWNKNQRFQGMIDTELSENGIRQAQKLARRLIGRKFAAIYSSDLKRAFATAQEIATGSGMEITAEPRFREMSFGEWEGLDYSGLGKKWQGKMNGFFRDPMSVAIPGGESFDDFCNRVCSAFYEVVARHEGQDVLIVSHGGSIRAIIADILKFPAASFWSVRLENTAVSIIQVADGRFLLSKLNDTTHLEESPLL